MIKEQFIKIKSIKPENDAKSFSKKYHYIARVWVTYHELTLCGRLVRGVKDDGSNFFFFEIPNVLVKTPKGKFPLNMVRFEDKRDSDLFQLIVLRQIESLHPELFEVKDDKAKNNA